VFRTECKISVKADPKILYVDDDNVTGFWDGTKEHPYQNITNALEHAIDGDTIFVHEGTYYENVSINENVSLVGEDRDSTIVDGNGTGSVISITVNNVSIKGFTVKGSGMLPYDSGIFLDEYSIGNDISHNTLTNNNYGIGLYYSSNNTVSGNTLTNNNNGIGLYYSSNNVVSGNTLTNNNYGIGVYFSSNSMVAHNTISSNNNYGIGVYYSSNNIVSGNTLTNNNYGIWLYSSNNIVSGNTLTNNNYGIYSTPYSSDNTIHCNNFNNTHQVWTDLMNIWDDGNEGNYWSDYTGQDLDGDGIGDNPYVIDVNNQDRYPLMGMFSDFSVALQRETYHVTTICNSTISDFKFEIGLDTGSKIIRFNATGKDSTVGFCRVMIPTELMNYPFIVLVDVEEIALTLLDISDETYVYLYFIYSHSSHTITIISSKTLYLYNELLDKHAKLQIDLYNVNTTYYDLLNNYGILLDNYSQLQKSYLELNSSYQKQLLNYSKNVQNIQSLTYIFAAATAIFIITTIYLSKRAHAGKTKVFENQKNRC
jgi:nitrous oxidase accessory protein